MNYKNGEYATREILVSIKSFWKLTTLQLKEAKGFFKKIQDH